MKFEVGDKVRTTVSEGIYLPWGDTLHIPEGVEGTVQDVDSGDETWYLLDLYIGENLWYTEDEVEPLEKL